MEQVTSIAAWVAKYGPLLSSFELDMNYFGPSKPCLDPRNRAAACAAFGSALQQAAATPQGLHLRSCKLKNVTWHCSASILQQLTVNSLTSLELQLKPVTSRNQNGCMKQLAGLLGVLPQLQQPRKLSLCVWVGSACT
jgi:hypothetical protein